ncbi:MAG: universal stress protein [Candidatus Binatia bacterium]
MTIERILVPVDFSKGSMNALKYATALGTSLKAELQLLHVVDQTYLASAPELMLANPKLATLLQEQWRAAEAQLAQIAADLKKHGRPVRALTKRGSPAQVIVDTARRGGVDLIVMGTHGRTGLAHALLGSVAERVVRTARCAVLTVRYSARKRP